jgi:hypothetical protein
MIMTEFLWLTVTHGAAFIGGGALVWVYKSYIQADVTKLNTIAKDVKKI